MQETKWLFLLVLLTILNAYCHAGLSNAQNGMDRLRREMDQTGNPTCDTLGGRWLDNKCFFVPDSTATWVDAGNVCGAYAGGHVASIASAAQNDIVAALVDDDVALWIGMSDKASEGEWLWSDGSPIEYQNWIDGQPDNGEDGQDCAVISTSSGKWEDQSCDLSKRFVCAVRTNPKCDELGGRWLDGDKKCFFVPDATATWSAADETCASYGGHIASIASRIENSMVYNLYLTSGAKDNHGRMWIGMSDQAVEGEWRWSDGGATVYENWSNNEPNNSGGQQDCAVMWKNAAEWDDQGCGETKPFVCAIHISPNPTCNGRGGRWLDNKCFFVPDATATWSAADETCASYGGHIASIASAAENQIVFDLYTSSGARSNHGRMWIGMSDQAVEGEWRWSDGGATVYENWSNNEPNNSGGQQDCAVMWKNAAEWDDQGCGETKPFVCAVRTHPTCDELAGVWLDNKCFFVPDAILAWPAAQTMCGELGGELASIETEAENDLVYGLYVRSGVQSNHGRMWIGISDRDVEGDWVWADGSSSSFQRWDTSQPDDHHGGQDCGLMWKDRKRWDDQKCDSEKPFVCAVYTGDRVPLETVY